MGLVGATWRRTRFSSASRIVLVSIMNIRLENTNVPMDELPLLEPCELPLFELDWTAPALEPARAYKRPSLAPREIDLLAELSRLAGDDG